MDHRAVGDGHLPAQRRGLVGAARYKGVEVVGAYPGGIDTDMLAGAEADKAAPETVAERIVAGLIAGQTVIWPDDASAGAGSLYLADPLGLERTLAA
ncbi:hypothetical protein [Pseudofrankia sp. DC12]|uniref:hypothetical protein n=1 Tax=Pseudofrankia sp. DC12 TaxID=683315 RepID=UPI0005F76688|nr:hypothetical protein [Pseudofrankia sp. DC12]